MQRDWLLHKTYFPLSRPRNPLPTGMQRDQLLSVICFPLPARYPLPFMDAEELAVALNLLSPSSQGTHFPHGCRGTSCCTRLASPFQGQETLPMDAEVPAFVIDLIPPAS